MQGGEEATEQRLEGRITTVGTGGRTEDGTQRERVQLRGKLRGADRSQGS